jgi:hypothetical protein
MTGRAAYAVAAIPKAPRKSLREQFEFIVRATSRLLSNSMNLIMADWRRFFGNRLLMSEVSISDAAEKSRSNRIKIAGSNHLDFPFGGLTDAPSDYR